MVVVVVVKARDKIHRILAFIWNSNHRNRSNVTILYKLVIFVFKALISFQSRTLFWPEYNLILPLSRRQIRFSITYEVSFFKSHVHPEVPKVNPPDTYVNFFQWNAVFLLVKKSNVMFC